MMHHFLHYSRYALLIILFQTTCMGTVQSQAWTLEQCIDSALTNNPALQIESIAYRTAEVQLGTARSSILPSVNAGITHGYNWGQTIDLFTNQFATQRVMYDNFYLNSSVILFAGLQNYYGQKVAALSLDDYKLKQKITERTVRIDVGAAYFQVLLNTEMVNIKRNHKNHSTALLEQTRELMSGGRATAYDLQELEAQVAQDQYEWVRAQNDLSYSQLILSQLLNLKKDTLFEIDSVHLFRNASDPDPVVSASPELARIELSKERQMYLIRSAKGRFYPTLTLSGALGSGYSENNKTLLADGTMVPKAFDDQLRSNFYQSAIITMTIPLFNKNTLRDQLRIRELELETITVQATQQLQALEQQLEQVRLDILNTTAQLEALEKVLQTSRKLYENGQISYAHGDISFTELADRKDRLYTAQFSLLEARYQLLLQQFILTCYEF